MVCVCVCTRVRTRVCYVFKVWCAISENVICASYWFYLTFKLQEQSGYIAYSFRVSGVLRV